MTSEGWAVRCNKKAPSTFQSKDASAALPQNCQTTKWMVELAARTVNVTLVTLYWLEVAGSKQFIAFATSVRGRS
jgi:hypothetical protein